MISQVFNAVRKWRENRLTLEALVRLSDSQLNDIGLRRFDLEDAVRRGGRF